MNKFAPWDRFIPKIISFIGYIPINFLPENLPGRIRAGRKLLGLSQEGLARYLKVDESTVADWEKSRHKPTRKSLEKLARFFTATIKLTGEEHANEPDCCKQRKSKPESSNNGGKVKDEK